MLMILDEYIRDLQEMKRIWICPTNISTLPVTLGVCVLGGVIPHTLSAVIKNARLITMVIEFSLRHCDQCQNLVFHFR